MSGLGIVGLATICTLGSVFIFQVFSSPLPNPAQFQTLSTWYTSKNQTIAYTMSTKSSSSDWIGLFKVGA